MTEQQASSSSAKPRRKKKSAAYNSSMSFCPVDGSLLLYEVGESGGGVRFCCQTCPFVHDLRERLEFSMKLKRKAVCTRACWLRIVSGAALLWILVFFCFSSGLSCCCSFRARFLLHMCD